VAILRSLVKRCEHTRSASAIDVRINLFDEKLNSLNISIRIMSDEIHDII
jgi:hypothetical protein